MAKRRTKTAIQKAYDKEYKRVQRLLRENAKRGYFTEPLLPERVKRPTKRSIARLEKIDRQYILDKAKAIDLETGEIVSAKTRAYRDRYRAAKKAAETRKRNKSNVSRETLHISTPEPLPVLPAYSEIVVGNFKAEMARMPGDNGNRIIGFINDLINREGIESVATMLENANNAGKMPSYGFLASGQEELVIDALGELINFMPDVSDAFKRDMIEDFEYHEGGY